MVLGGGKGSSQWGVSASRGFSSGGRALHYHQLASKVQWPIWEVNVEKIKSEKLKFIVVVLKEVNVEKITSEKSKYICCGFHLSRPPGCPTGPVDTSVEQKWWCKCENM